MIWHDGQGACLFSKRLERGRFLRPSPADGIVPITRQRKVIQTVRERFSCRECETIAQPPAPFHVIPRGHARPNVLAMVLFEKYGQRQPLNRQSAMPAKESICCSRR